MNGCASFGDQCRWMTGHYRSARRRYFDRLPRGRQMSGLTAFMIAVGGTSVICFLLMSRAQNRSATRSAAGDGSGDGAGYDSGGDGGNAFSWFGGDNSTSNNSGPSGDSGGGDGGGGDGGGGGGGGD
jgi:hypothetical protein